MSHSISNSALGSQVVASFTAGFPSPFQPPSPPLSSTNSKRPCPSPKLANHYLDLSSSSSIPMEPSSRKIGDSFGSFKEQLEVSFLEEEKLQPQRLTEVRELEDREGAEKLKAAHAQLGKELHRQLLEDHCMNASTRANSRTNFSSTNSSVSPMKSASASDASPGVFRLF